jgi:caa(3)-type oxidase subunit IV
MGTLMRAPASVAWLALCGLTVLSWMLGTGTDLGQDQLFASLAIIAVAVFKIRLIGLYFMELREAPKIMRVVMEVYCAALLVLLAGLFVAA